MTCAVLKFELSIRVVLVTGFFVSFFTTKNLVDSVMLFILSFCFI